MPSSPMDAMHLTAAPACRGPVPLVFRPRRPAADLGGLFGFTCLERRSKIMRGIRHRLAGDARPRDATDHHHHAGNTVWTLAQCAPGQGLVTIAVVRRCFGR